MPVANDLEAPVKENLLHKETKDVARISCALITRLLSSLDFAAPTAEKILLDHGILYKDLSFYYLLPFRVCTESQLREFQFKILHNILPSRAQLANQNG